MIKKKLIICLLLLLLSGCKRVYNNDNYIEYVYNCLDNNKSKVIIDLNDDQYLKVYYDDKKYSLQAWKHLEEYDFLEYYVLSNYYDEFVTDKTIITNANEKE